MADMSPLAPTQNPMVQLGWIIQHCQLFLDLTVQLDSLLTTHLIASPDSVKPVKQGGIIQAPNGKTKWI